MLSAECGPSPQLVPHQAPGSCACPRCPAARELFCLACLSEPQPGIECQKQKSKEKCRWKLRAWPSLHPKVAFFNLPFGMLTIGPGDPWATRAPTGQLSLYPYRVNGGANFLVLQHARPSSCWREKGRGSKAERFNEQPCGRWHILVPTLRLVAANKDAMESTGVHIQSPPPPPPARSKRATLPSKDGVWWRQRPPARKRGGATPLIHLDLLPVLVDTRLMSRMVQLVAARCSLY
ncbi:hypothetical protein B0H67DRAFT_9533 [Lasiosphaeris hirsuta]|uniref:Uncharacterized protein n=1 Tax=Lasiosphaeris hirsuta TaxID=260670 RepID=A0AA40B8W1_9PEZI|nr:hypothetical protein B0H67DRAFT_9533 [Lasiosphaeris hirsuta]